MFLLPTAPHDTDAPIRATDCDALTARVSAVQKGYLNDAYVQHFVTRRQPFQMRPPLINIGTYVRSESIDRLVESWIDISRSEGKKCQIISLGAGSDTRFWRLAPGSRQNSERGDAIAKYVEIDFPEITTKKAMTMRKNRGLNAALGQQARVGNGGTSLHSSVYHLIAADLRAPPEKSLSVLTTSQGPDSETILDRKLPTLLLFECVLAYMVPSASANVLAWFTKYFRGSGPLGAIVYEMFGLEDAFGRVMKSNLKSRDVELPGVDPYTSKTSLPRRFTEHDYTLSHALTLKEIKDRFIPKRELSRIFELEMLDEVEELDLLLSHYAITWAADLQNGSSPQWGSWGLSEAQTQGYVDQ